MNRLKVVKLAGCMVLAVGASASAQHRNPPVVAHPDPTPVLDKVCLPFLQTGDIAAATRHAVALGYAAQASSADLASLGKTGWGMTLTPGSCSFYAFDVSTTDWPSLVADITDWARTRMNGTSVLTDTDSQGLSAIQVKASGMTLMAMEALGDGERNFNISLTKP